MSNKGWLRTGRLRNKTHDTLHNTAALLVEKTAAKLGYY